METTPVDSEVKEDKHGLDKMPDGAIVRVVKGDDGTVAIRRELDDAAWDGEQFVASEPLLNTYAVTVLIGAIDEPTARDAVAAALRVGAVEAEVMPLAELRHEERL